MGIGSMRQGGRVPSQLRQFIVDTESEMANLPTNIIAGSTALVVETGQTYILNNEKKWKLFSSSGQSSGGSSGDGSTSKPTWEPFRDESAKPTWQPF